MTVYTPEYRIKADGTEITDYTLVGFNITSGRTDLNYQAQAGYASIRILNLTNTVYSWSINTAITIEIKNSSGTFIPVFGGRISDIAVGVDKTGEAATVTVIDIYALGSLTKLQNAVWNGSLSKAFEGIQIKTILGSLLANAWNEVSPSQTWAAYDATETWANAQSPGLGEIDEGEYEMIARSADPINMYDIVSKLADSGLGYIYEDGNGNIAYGDADHRQNYLVANGYVNLDANHALYDGIKSVIRQGDLVNSVTINYKNNFGTNYTYENAASISDFGLYARSIDSFIDDTPDAEAVAQRYVNYRANPKAKFESITFALQNAEIDNGDRNSLIGVFMGMPVAIANLPTNISEGEFFGYVEGWTFRSSLSGLSITLNLSPTEFWTVAQAWDQVFSYLKWSDLSGTLTWENATGVIN